MISCLLTNRKEFVVSAFVSVLIGRLWPATKRSLITACTSSNSSYWRSKLLHLHPVSPPLTSWWLISPPSFSMSSIFWQFVSDDFQDITGHIACLLSACHFDEAAAFALTAHADLTARKEMLLHWQASDKIKKTKIFFMCSQFWSCVSNPSAITQVH